MSCVIRSEGTRRRVVIVLQMLGIAAAYYASGRLGLLRKVTVEGSVVTPLWPPSGIALASLLYLGTRIWPGIALGALLTVIALSDGLTFWGLAITAGSTLAPLCSFLALRAVGFRTELDRLRDGVALVFLGALGGMIISSTTGTVVQLLNGSLSGSRFWAVWSAWWAGDAMGVLMVTPASRPAQGTHAEGGRPVDGGPGARGGRGDGDDVRDQEPAVHDLSAVPGARLGRAPLPAGLQRPCALLMSVMAIVAGTEGVGPFDGHSVLEVMLNLCVLNGCVALTALLLAAIVTEHNNIRHETEVACEELAALVEKLAPGPPGRLARPDEPTGESG